MEIKKQIHRNKKIKEKIIIFLAILFVLFLIPQTRSIIIKSTSFISTPIARVSNNIGNSFYNFRETLRLKSSLVSENLLLTQKIENLNSEFSGYDEVVRENKELKSAMGRNTENNQFILASVLSKPPVSLYDTLLVDGGSNVGIKEGQTVYAYGDIPIGTIERALSSSALVRLYSSAGEKMDARLDPDHIDVTLFGRGGGNFLVSLPHDFVVATSTVIVSKELNPKLLARLEKITSDARDSSQTLLLSSPVNINGLSFVEIAQ